MGACSKIYCEIYRDKKYCSKTIANHNGMVCDCSHAGRLCDIAVCPLEKDCPLMNGMSKTSMRKLL